ncbi:TnsD family Tn7-like transposition protein [Pseudomonas fluorescens]|uniref:TnsD family Tn7-like transposition protein n=1 Tax=Pseudomonas fluorescens TaxID=294 RepID=UPI003F9E391B
MDLKFHFFLAAFPDETLHSVLSRYARLCGVRSVKTAFAGARFPAAFSQSVAFPSHLDELVEALPCGTSLSVVEIIKRHTLLPYYAPFVSQNQVDQAQALMAGDGTGLMLKLGVNASRLGFASRMRFCPECVAQDQVRAGVAYWHRVHTLPGVLVCPYHCTLLNVVDHCWFSRNSRQLNLPGDDSVQAHSRRLHVPSICLPALHDIALRSLQVLESEVVALSAFRIRSTLLQGADELELTSKARCLHLRRLAQHMAVFFRSLPTAWEYLVLSEAREGIPATWITKLLRKPRSSHHPLKYILLASALRVNMESVLGKGALCEPQTASPLTAVTQLPKFAPSMFAIEGLDCISTAVWEHALAGADARKMASALGVSLVHVYRIIRGVAGGPAAWKEARFLRQLRERRMIFDAEYRSRRAHDCRGYAWLYRCDRPWLSECIAKRATDHANRADSSDMFAALDVKLAKQVGQCARALRSLPGKPIRISRTRIGRELHVLSRFEKQLSKLPLCAAALIEACESLEEFHNRRLRWARQKLRSEGKPVSQSSLYRTASIRLRI